MIEFNQNNQSILPKLNPLLDYLTILNQNSNIIPIIIYPIQECYNNWINIFIKEYPTRSALRATITTTSFAAGPLLIEFANFTWLADRSRGLYETIPVFNLLPEKVGTYLCSAYLCGYFSAWAIHQITNLYTKFKFDGSEHYLTPTKTSEIHQKMINNNFNITSLELQKIFTDINQQWRRQPSEKYLLKMLCSIRNGDLQTVIDNANLLENQIATVEHKIAVIQQNLNQVDHNLIPDSSEIPTGSNNLISANNNSSEIPTRSNNTNTTEMTAIDNTDVNIVPNNSYTDLNQALHSPLATEFENIRLLSQNIRDINTPPVAGILHQYANKKKNKTRDNNANTVIDNLNHHKQQLINKRYLNPNKSYVMHG